MASLALCMTISQSELEQIATKYGKQYHFGDMGSVVLRHMPYEFFYQRSL